MPWLRKHPVCLGWHDPLPKEFTSSWQHWKNALPDLQNVSILRCFHPAPDLQNVSIPRCFHPAPDLQNVSIPRCFHPVQFSPTTRAEMHAFSDSSERAIGVAVYLLLFNPKGEACISFVFGQAKVAPITPISIPRLELCGAVLAVQAVDRITKEIDLAISDTVFYTDLKVVLVYVCNESRRFHHVQAIRKISSLDQWRYV